MIQPPSDHPATGSASGASAAATEAGGLIYEDEVCRILRISRHQLKAWRLKGRVRSGTWGLKPTGGKCKLYDPREIEQLRVERTAELAAAAGTLPEGFVGREEACRIVGVSMGTWKRWQRAGRVPGGQMIRLPGQRSAIKVYHRDTLLRLREELIALLPATRKAEREQREIERAAQQPPAGWVRWREAMAMFGVTTGQWVDWHKKGWVRGRKFGPKWYYDVAELEKLVAENGRVQPPHPDPDRPGVWRVPIRTSRMRKREVLIDADAMPLIEGRHLNWSETTRKYPGFVAISDPKFPVALRRLVMGVTDPELYVVHNNGDPLDCRRENLAIKTAAQHCQGNRKIEERNGRPCTSQYKGVCWEERTGSWVAQISVDGNHRRIGRFKDELAAAEAYDEAAAAAWGEHARLNFPNGIDAALEFGDPPDPPARAA